MTRLLRLLAACTALTLLAAGCGDDDDSSAPPSTGDEQPADTGGDEGDEGGDDEGSGDVPDPCSFLTLADLESLFASPFEEGTPTDNVEAAGTRQCTWGNTDAPPVKIVSIAVGTDASQRAAFNRGAEELFGLTRTAFEDGDAIEEADLGFGDQSYRAGSSAYVLDGDTSYTFLVSGTSEDAIAGLKEMAAKVVDG